MRTLNPALAGEELEFDASASSDPDGDSLLFSWWQYQEAGTYPGRVFIENANADNAKVFVPRLFGGPDSKVVLWSDFKRAAAVHTNWPLHKVSALEDLKEECIRRGLWRQEGNHIRRGPFPPPAPEVAIRELSVENEGDGRTYLKSF